MILKIEGLTKYFGSRCVVKSLDMEVKEGDIYGFLGLNGAGKTTTIRMILHLIRPSSGKVFIFGKHLTQDYVNIMANIGALVEQPAYYPHLSSEENLEILRLLSKKTPRSRIKEILRCVGLDHKGRVGTFSQGMRQRLGIAMALLAEPSFVILDEPTNGLDPQGVIDIRNLIKDLNKNGITFLISSHLLHEIEITCNRVGIIVKGKMIIQGDVDKFLERTITGCNIKANPIDRAQEVISKLDYVKEFKLNEGRIRVKVSSHDFTRLNRDLVQSGVEVGELVPSRLSLEDFFLLAQKEETRPQLTDLK